MRRSQILFIAILLLIIISVAGFQYIFSIYEVEIRVSSYVLYADNKSECIIQAVPLNSFGIKAPLRNASAKIEIKEGIDLIEVLQLDPEQGIIRFKAKERTGFVIINIKPDKALLPTSVELRIEPNVT